MSKMITLNIAFEIDLTKDQVWPDGDAPKQFAAEDVLDVIRGEYDNAVDLLENWSLGPYSTQSVIATVCKNGLFYDEADLVFGDE